MSAKLVFLLVAGAAPVLAQLDRAPNEEAELARQDQAWAQKSGLTVDDVHALRTAAGITHLWGPGGSRIANLDTTSLKDRHQILLVEGFCLRVHVYERKGEGFAEVRAVTDIPDPDKSIAGPGNHPGRCIGIRAPIPPSAHATPDGKIVVEVPVLTELFVRPIPVSTYTFVWDGTTYRWDESR